MGADMVLFTLWSETKDPTSSEAVKAVRKALQAENDLEALNRAAGFVGADLDDLATAVVVADPAAMKSWKQKIVTGYHEAIDNFLDTLTNRDVTTIHVGSLIGYSTGGLTWGDSPTDTYDAWARFLEATDENDEPLNPYGALIYDALFVTWSERYTSPGGRFVRTTIHRAPAHESTATTAV
jgi:hypothetical protein